MTDKLLIDRAVVEQALEALLSASTYNERQAAIATLRAALEQPAEQEKLAIMQRIVDSNTGFIRNPTTPQPAKQPLTEEEIEDLYFDGFSISKLKAFARAIERAHGIGIK